MGKAGESLINTARGPKKVGESRQGLERKDRVG